VLVVSANAMHISRDLEQLVAHAIALVELFFGILMVWQTVKLDQEHVVTDMNAYHLQLTMTLSLVPMEDVLAILVSKVLVYLLTNADVMHPIPFHGMPKVSLIAIHHLHLVSSPVLEFGIAVL